MKETQKIYSPLRDYPMFEDDPEDSSKSPLLLHPNRPGAGNASAGKVRSVPEREEELPKTEKREEEAEEVPEYVFRIKYILCAIALVLFLMAIFSYDPLDSSIIDGGTKAPLSNWGGQIGACLSKYFFYIFGLASYPIVLLLSLCAVRPFIPVPMKRKGYFLSLAAVILGITLLMAISPQDFVLRTDALGSIRRDFCGSTSGRWEPSLPQPFCSFPDWSFSSLPTGRTSCCGFWGRKSIRKLFWDGPSRRKRRKLPP